MDDHHSDAMLSGPVVENNSLCHQYGSVEEDLQKVIILLLFYGIASVTYTVTDICLKLLLCIKCKFLFV